MPDAILIGLVSLVITTVGVTVGVLAYLRKDKPPGLGFFDWLEIRRRVREAKNLAYVQWMDEWLAAIKRGEGRSYSVSRLREILDDRLSNVYGNHPPCSEIKDEGKDED